MEKDCSNNAAAKNFGVDEKNIRRWKGQSDSLHKVINNGFSKAKQRPRSGRRPLSELSPDKIDYTLFFYKNKVYKNIEAQNC